MTVSMPEAAIMDALALHMAAFVADPAIPVSYPGIPFTKPDGPYFQTEFMPNRPRDPFVAEDSAAIYEGLYQIKAYTAPRSAIADTGVIGLAVLAGTIGRHFGRGTTIHANGLRLKVTATPQISSSMTEVDRTSIPVTVRWQAVRTRAALPVIQMESPATISDGAIEVTVAGLPDADISLFDEYDKLDTKIGDEGGLATFAINLGVGDHTLTATQVFGAGLSSRPSSAVQITVGS